MNFVDLFLGIALLLGAGYGWSRGLVRGLLALLGIVASVWIALLRGGWAGDLFGGRFGLSPVTTAWIGTGILFAASLALVLLFTALLDRLVRASPLSPLNAVGGGTLGLLNTALFLGLLLSFLTLHPPHSRLPGRIAESALAKPVSRVSRALVSYIRAASPGTEDLVSRLKGDRGSLVSRDPSVAGEIARRAEQVRTQVDSLMGPGGARDTSRAGLPVPGTQSRVGPRDSVRSTPPGAKVRPAPREGSREKPSAPAHRPPARPGEPVML